MYRTWRMRRTALLHASRFMLRSRVSPMVVKWRLPLKLLLCCCCKRFRRPCSTRRGSPKDHTTPQLRSNSLSPKYLRRGSSRLLDVAGESKLPLYVVPWNVQVERGDPRRSNVGHTGSMHWIKAKGHSRWSPHVVTRFFRRTPMNRLTFLYNFSVHTVALPRHWNVMRLSISANEAGV